MIWNIFHGLVEEVVLVHVSCSYDMHRHFDLGFD